MTEWRVEGGERGLCISFFVHQLYAMEQTIFFPYNFSRNDTNIETTS